MSQIKYPYPEIALVLILASLLFMACGDSVEPVDPVAEADLCLSENSCVVSAEGDSSTVINVTNCGNSAPLNWSTSQNRDWFSLSVDTGSTPGSFTITADTNRTYSARTGLVIVTADGIGGVAETLSVTQPLVGSELSLSTDEWRCSAECDTSFSVTITNSSNTSVFPWAASSNSSWLSMYPASGNTPGWLVMVADSNHSGQVRWGKVTVSATGLTDVSASIDVTQSPLPPILSVSLSQWDAPSLGGDSPEILVTNCGDMSSIDWEITEDIDWLTLSAENGQTPGSFTMTVDANNTGLSRTGTITVTAEGVAGSPWQINVEQTRVIALVGYYDTGDWVFAISALGEYVYVSDGIDGFQVIDISDPSSPTLSGSYSMPYAANDLFVYGDYAYLAYIGIGLWIIDVSNPSSPTKVGDLAIPDLISSVFVSGDYAYLGNDQGKFWVINVTNPYSPAVVGSCQLPSGWISDIFVSGNYAYLAAEELGGLLIINVSNPSSPTLVGSYDTPGSAYDVFVSGDYAYVAAGESGLQIVDITNPSSPTLVGGASTSGDAFEVLVRGSFAHMADGEEGLQIFDVSDPSSPIVVVNYHTPDLALCVSMIDDYVIVADRSYGLYIFELGSDFRE